jgi:hypothetical protein
MARGDSYQLQGQQGGVVIAAGENASGNFRWIQVVTDTVLQSLSSPNLNDATGQGPNNLLIITLPAGLGIGGKFSFIQVTSGVVIAYYE